jgi:hypothetical protein
MSLALTLEVCKPNDLPPHIPTSLSTHMAPSMLSPAALSHTFCSLTHTNAHTGQGDAYCVLHILRVTPAQQA